MKHTEVYVEQVIIGFCVLVIVYVLVTGRVPALADKGLVAGAIAIGASYVIGILYDRCADSLLDRLDRWNRLRYATFGKPDVADGCPVWFSDPFPEFARRLLASEGASPYLQSRVRLMRAMTTLIPAMAVAFIVARANFDPAPSLLILAGTVACYFVVPLLSGSCEVVPRTDQVAKLNEFIAARRRAPKDGRLRLQLFPSRYEPAIAAFALLIAELLYVARLTGDGGMGLVVAAAAVLLTFLFGWSWRRISLTYFSFLRDARAPRQSDRT